MLLCHKPCRFGLGDPCVSVVLEGLEFGDVIGVLGSYVVKGWVDGEQEGGEDGTV